MLKIKGTLEIDTARGVIYFHNEQDRTLLRVCRLPRPIPAMKLIEDIHGGITLYLNFLDVTHMHGCSWKGDTP